MLCRVSLPRFSITVVADERAVDVEEWDEWSFICIVSTGSCFCSKGEAKTKFLDEVDTETTPFLWTGQQQVEVSKRAHVIKAALYAVQNFYAFMLM